MLASILGKSFAALVILTAVFLLPGCQGTFTLVPGDQTTPGTDNGSATTTPQTPSGTTTSLTVTAPAKDVSSAVGQPVLVAWEIQGLPDNPTVDILYHSNTNAADKTLLGGLLVSDVGSVQIDTSSFVPGLTYTITVRLNSGGSQVASAPAPGRILMVNPQLTVTSPTTDSALLPSQTLTITWTGKYLPEGGSLDAFLDSDTTFNSGNEIVVQSNPLPASGPSVSGSMTLQAADLFTNSKINRGVPYYIGLRVVKNGQTFLAGYATATTLLYNGQGFNILVPQGDTSVRFGDNLQIKWTTLGVPTGLKVRLQLTDRITASVITGPTDYSVTDGAASFLTYSLTPGHSCDLVLMLLEGQNVIATRQATGTITTTTDGSSIFITNPDLQQATDTVYLGKGTRYDITWVAVQSPQNALVKLFLDEDGNLATTADQVEITPSGGVASGLNHFLFTPSDPIPGDRNYFVVAQLVASGTNFTQGRSAGKIHVGEGGVKITTPATDQTVGIGDNVTIEWEFTGNILSKFPTKKKFLRLYANELPLYDNATVIELTDKTTGLDVTAGVTSFPFDTSVLSTSKSYFIVARLFVEDNPEEESRSASTGKITLAPIQLLVITPDQDITSPSALQAISVSWQITGVSTTGRKIRILAVPVTNPSDPGLAVSGDYPATNTSGLADVTKLPPNTYIIRCLLFELDAEGFEVNRATGDAPGKVIIADGYNRIYDLADMMAATKLNYSPIDGTIFTGFNIGDETGYDVAGVGNLDNASIDSCSDFVIFSRFGQEYTGGNAGSAYLIYGTNNLNNHGGKVSLIPLNSIPPKTDPNPLVEGTLLLFPMENLATNDNGTITGGYNVMGLPDVSNDGKGDLLIGCPDAAPLVITYWNNTDAAISITFDHWGRARTVPADTGIDEPLHVYPFIEIDGYPLGVMDSSGKWTSVTDTRRVLFFGNHDPDPFNRHYMPGDYIQIRFYKNLLKDNVTDTEFTIFQGGARGAVYLLTSQRLTTYRNDVYDLSKIGSPVEDGANDTDAAYVTGYGIWQSWTGDSERPMMLTRSSIGARFGSAVSIIPDIDGNGYPQFMVASENDDVQNIADPNRPWRDNAGSISVRDAQLRVSSTPTFIGRIGWFWGSADYSGSPKQTIDRPAEFEILGPDNDTHLSGMGGLGRFASADNYSSYINGDFDGDHVVDYVVSTPLANNAAGTTEAGAVYIIKGRTVIGRRTTILDLADFNKAVPPGSDPSLEVPVLGVKITGTLPSEHLGQIIKSAGDFNGDGLADVMFIMPHANAGVKSEAGRVVILFGQKGVIGDFTADQLSSAMGTLLPSLIFEGQNEGDHFGSKIAAVYDVNGDGIDDILVGAPDAGGPGKNGCGKVYLIYGKKNIVKQDPITKFYYVDYDGDGQPDGVWSAQKIGQEGGLPGAVFLGEQAGDHLSSVASAGDADGDGIADFIIGAPDANVTNVQLKAGKAYLICGKKYTLPTPTP